MGNTQEESHIDNDIAFPLIEGNDNDNVESYYDSRNNYRREHVLKNISEYRLNRVEEFLYGDNKFMSDCSAFINPAIKQIERFMYLWYIELDEESRKNIVTHRMGLIGVKRRPYSSYTNSPLWKYQSSVLKLLAHFTCEKCEKKFCPAGLIVHHISYEHLGSELEHPEDVAVFCDRCHMDIHGIRRKDEQGR